MPNQYTKVPLFIDSNDDTYIDNSLLSTQLSIAVIETLKTILPKDIETLGLLINKVKDDM